MTHTITYLSTRPKNLPPTRGRGSWRNIPASRCPKCSCGWIGMWADQPTAESQAQAHLEEVETPQMTAVLGRPVAPKVRP